MEDESQLLDEVVVVSVGYGNARKRDLTGAISSVGENTLKNIPVTSASSALTGRLAGVSVITSEVLLMLLSVFVYVVVVLLLKVMSRSL